MRVLIETHESTAGWTITFRDPVTGADLAPSRTVARCQPPNQRFPLPPAHQEDDCEKAAHLLCLDSTGNNMQSGLDSISRVDVPAGHVDIFGGYLFQVLIGENWAALQSAAGGGDIELEILIEPKDAFLKLLPWEMMFARTTPAGAVIKRYEPLGVQRDRKVSITRVIELAQAGSPPQTLPQPQPVQLPLKVLFIVGRQLDDALRPGAELIGLLRRVPLPNPTFTTFQIANLHVRYLPEATWDEIQAAVSEFAPTVVHIVSHGELDAAGRQTHLLLTSREIDGKPDSAKTVDPYPCSPQRLLALLTVDGELPPVVIVNACHTADQDGQNAADLAFSAQLVAGGVPMALGMSGEVADRACQVFTMSFYQALLKGSSVAIASAQGRRAALLEFPDALHNVEWTRPTLFVSKGIDPALKTVPAARDLSAIAERYRTLKTPDALCDRFECMTLYEEFRKSLPAPPGKAAAMAFVTKDPQGGIGKSRLLEELAARSVFDGFIPVIVRNNRKNSEAPQNMLEVAWWVSDAVRETRAHYGLPEIPLPETRKFAYRLTPVKPNPSDQSEFRFQEDDLDLFLRTNRTTGRPAEVTIDSALGLIQDECTQLRSDVQGAFPVVPTVLLLLDDLHRYPGCAQQILPRIGEYGLGKAGIPLPVVFTCLLVENDKTLLEDLSKRQDIRVKSLNAFESELEQRLACRQFVLSHWKASVSARREQQAVVDRFYKRIHSYTNGRPVQFLRAEVEGVVQGNLDSGTLVPTDFEGMLAKWK
jgi:hypothetical protein